MHIFEEKKLQCIATDISNRRVTINQDHAARRRNDVNSRCHLMVTLAQFRLLFCSRTTFTLKKGSANADEMSIISCHIEQLLISHYQYQNRFVCVYRLEGLIMKILYIGQKNGLHSFCYNSAESETIWMKSGTVWAKCWGLAVTDFGRDPSSSDSLRGSRCLVFCPVNNARFHRFPVGHTLRHLNATTSGICLVVTTDCTH